MPWVKALYILPAQNCLANNVLVPMSHTDSDAAESKTRAQTGHAVLSVVFALLQTIVFSAARTILCHERSDAVNRTAETPFCACPCWAQFVAKQIKDEGDAVYCHRMLVDSVTMPLFSHAPRHVRQIS